MTAPAAAPFNFHRPAAHFRTRPGTAPRLQVGDRVVWRNPATGGHHGGLRIEFVYPSIGTVLLRGDFGRMSLRTGGPHIESRRVRIEQVTADVAAPAGVL